MPVAAEHQIRLRPFGFRCIPPIDAIASQHLGQYGTIDRSCWDAGHVYRWKFWVVHDFLLGFDFYMPGFHFKLLVFHFKLLVFHFCMHQREPILTG